MGFCKSISIFMHLLCFKSGILQIYFNLCMHRSMFQIWDFANLFQFLWFCPKTRERVFLFSSLMDALFSEDE
jgi:hypothetical protein